MSSDRADGREHGGPARVQLHSIGPAMALLPLRVFLGITFAYAGVQKLSDPGFLHPGAPTYIGTQLATFAHGTPGGFLLRTFALPDPRLAGVAVAFVEILVGLLVLAGLLTRLAAGVGLALNLLLFLTNSWNTYPYFLGSDIVFVFAWLPFVLTGATGQPALDTTLDRVVASKVLAARRAAAASKGRRPRQRVPATPAPAVTRRSMLARALGATGVLALAIAAVSTLIKGSYAGGSTAQLGAQAPGGAPANPAGPAGAGSTGARTGPSAGAGTGTAGSQQSAQAAAGGSGKPPAQAVRLGAASQLPRNEAALYRDPGDGQPDIIIRHADGSLNAFSAICTHQGCEVGYQSGQIVCPCHGGVYNARTGAVEGGPPPAPLPPRRVIQYHQSIYAIPD